MHVADNSAKAQRDDWVFSLAEEPSKKVSGERLGFVYGKEMLRRRFDREVPTVPRTRAPRASAGPPSAPSSSTTCRS